MRNLFARCIIVLAMALPSASDAAHIAGASVSYTCVGGNFYQLHLDLYVSCATSAIVGTQTLRLNNSCGVFFQISGVPQAVVEEVSPVCTSQLPQTTCNAGGTLPGYRHYRFTTSATYLSPCNFWTIQWTTCCRDETENIQNTPGIHAEATLNNLGGLCDNSPRFADNGVPFVCLGQPVSYNPGVSDPNGNPLSYSLIGARFDSVNTVLYDAGFTGLTPIPGISINAVTGQVYFTPVVSGRYVIVVRVDSYSLSTGQLIGTVMRDLMFFVSVCDGSPPVPAPSISISGTVAGSGASSVALCNGQSFCADLVVSDPNTGTVLEMTSNASTILPGATFTVTGTNPATARICWTANAAILPANVLISISDGACPVQNTASRSIYVGNCVLLPVELLGFTAEAEGAGVGLHWSTAGEVYSDHFMIERSVDGMVFHAIGRVESVGLANGSTDYTFRDDYPMLGTSYYRLRQMDRDGSSSFGPIASVEFGKNRNVLAIRNGTTSWSITGLDAAATWTVMDALGRTVDVGIPQSTSEGLRLETGYDQSQVLIFSVVTGGQRHTFRLPPTAQDGQVIASRGTE
ncbi:MAG: hypothetical protein JNM62_16855 [Flavobacteriales bacterium]|nr:hypothetical protein [Flavobacteriales bacterium]